MEVHARLLSLILARRDAFSFSINPTILYVGSGLRCETFCRYCALKCYSDHQCNPTAGGRCSTGFVDNFCSYPTPPAPTATPLKALLKRLASAIGPAVLGGR